MTLLGELRDHYEKVKKLDGEIVAVALESKASDDPRKTLERSKARFVVLNGSGGAWRKRYEHLYVYVIDATGIVRRVFGSTVRARLHGAQVVEAFEEVVKE